MWQAENPIKLNLRQRTGAGYNTDCTDPSRRLNPVRVVPCEQKYGYKDKKLIPYSYISWWTNLGEIITSYKWTPGANFTRAQQLSQWQTLNTRTKRDKLQENHSPFFNFYIWNACSTLKGIQHAQQSRNWRFALRLCGFHRKTNERNSADSTEEVVTLYLGWNVVNQPSVSQFRELSVSLL